MIDYLLLATGVVVLAIGGDNLIRGAVGLAENFRVPPLIIGLTIVAMGTSAPELLVSVRAAFDGSGGIAIGNVIGSNIANILLVMALPSLFRPTPCNEAGIAKNLLVLVGITIVFMGMLAKGSLQRYDGLILILIIGLFVYDQLQAARGHRRAAKAGLREEVGKTPHRPTVIAIMLIGGLIALPVGAELTIRGASGIAASWGVSQEAIGLTVVAVGTSLPELAASVLAVVRGNHSVALGNVVGSNIFNIGFIMGVTAGLFPVGVASRIVWFDMWVMLACALLVALLARLQTAIGRPLAIGMLAAYSAYVAANFMV